ncbi:MAG: glycosyl hydrolase family 18 protein [Candidatus Paceibacterota bacterium]
MKQILKIIFLGLVITSIFLPNIIFAATKTPFYYAGWIPFWKDQAGAHDLSIHLNSIYEISPFSYEVNSKGKLIDSIQINKGFWPGWLTAVRGTKTKVIPTIAWFDGDNIHKILSNKTSRINQENAITKLVKDQKFDGIDIDYEAKLADTNKYFALFIEGLAIRLHPLKKTLSCTIEPRMPVSSRYTQTGTDEDTLYANDYATLNKYCDEIRIMAYDQGVVDIKLDVSKGNGQLYAPVADPDWVEKVVKEATKIISPKKIMLGVPTYGYEYQVTWNNGITTYYRLRSHTYTQAMERAKTYGATPQRNSAGELSFTYSTSTFVSDLSKSLIWTVSSTKPTAIISTGTSTPTTRYVSFTDAQSINQKITLAKKLGLRGVVFFKWDGEQDPSIWKLLK